MGALDGFLTISVFILNFILFVGAVFVLYILLFTSKASSEELIEDLRANDQKDGEPNVVSKSFLAICVFIAILSFIGCYGVATDNKFYLLLYSTVIVIVIIFQVIVGIIIYQNFNQTRSNIDSQVSKIFKADAMNSSNAAFMHEFQRKFNCCGYNSMNDWLEKLQFIPGSCCEKSSAENCSGVELLKIVALKPPCKQVFDQQIGHFKRIITVIIGVMFGLEGVLAGFTLCIIIRSH